VVITTPAAVVLVVIVRAYLAKLLAVAVLLKAL
jgi:hypothetical protein